MRQLKAKEIPSLRKHLLKMQKGRCAICKQDPKRPCLDHEHIKKIKGTGQIRGVLCSNCNILLAKSENNCVRYGIKVKDLPTILRSMANYLERKQYPYIHPSEAPKPKKLMKSSYNKLKKVYTGIAKFPDYPKSGKLIVKLEWLFKEYGITPEFYK